MNAPRFFDNSQYSDVSVQAESKGGHNEHNYFAHRVILASASPYLDAILKREGISKHIILPLSDRALNIALCSMYGLEYALPSTLGHHQANDESDVVDEIFDCATLCALFEEVRMLGCEKINGELWTKIVDAVWRPQSDVATHTAIFGLVAKYNMMTPIATTIGCDMTMAKFLLQCNTIEHILRVSGDDAWKRLIYWAALHPTVNVDKLATSIDIPPVTRDTTPELETYADVDNLSCVFSLLGKRHFVAGYGASKNRRELMNYKTLKRLAFYDPLDPYSDVDTVPTKIEPDEEKLRMCHYITCSLPQQPNTRVCKVHRCTAGTCTNVVALECTLCPDHIDAEITNDDVTCEFCTIETPVIKGAKCCYEHTCNAARCYAPRMGGGGWCSHHRITEDKDGAEDMTSCSYDTCYKRHLPGVHACREHRCRTPGCINAVVPECMHCANCITKDEKRLSALFDARWSWRK